MTLAELRQRIDEIDSKLIALLDERADSVHEVGQLKKRDGMAIYAPEREEQLLQSLIKKSKGRLPEKSIRAIYREIMSASLALEKHLVIAFAGPEVACAHQAALQKFGASVDYAAQPDVGAVFNAVSQTQADYGVVPIGESEATLDALIESELKICAQFSAPLQPHGRATRFVVIGHATCPPSGHDQTSLMVRNVDETMKVFERLKIRANQLGTRAGFGFLEVDGHAEDAVLANAFAEIERGGVSVKMLGSYPKSPG